MEEQQEYLESRQDEKCARCAQLFSEPERLAHLTMFLLARGPSLLLYMDDPPSDEASLYLGGNIRRDCKQCREDVLPIDLLESD